jgi:thiol-disulfide isomerase/thioredoxin
MQSLRALGLRAVGLAAALAWTAALGGCQASAVRVPVQSSESEIAPGRVYAVLLNGGAQRRINYQSHLLHVRGVIDRLERSGVPAENITIFSADGPNPAKDLATREVEQQDDFWLLPRSGLGGFLRPTIRYANSTVDGFTLQPASKEALRTWFADVGTRLAPGDTLLFYVTDHGDKNEDDLSNNTISLWGETLSVQELKGMLALVDPQVRVVMLMSQCFSGAFAHTIADAEEALPNGNVCGYFASTADRPAYGCYPENLGKDAVGHSHHILEALEELGSLSQAHRRVLVTDDSPDVPNTTADFFLSRMLERAADAVGEDRTQFADAMIAHAWEHKGDWEPEIRLLDRIGQTFGFFSPRSLSELHQQAEILPAVSRQLRTYAQRWQEALEALAAENLTRFLAAHRAWERRLAPDELKKMKPRQRRVTAQELVKALTQFTKRDKDTYDRMLVLKQRADDAGQASYRMEVRLGVVLRMRTLLLRIAGTEYLNRFGSEAERNAFGRLVACEDLNLNPQPTVLTAAALPAPESFPPLAEDRRLVEAVMPAWMGIRYRPLEDGDRKREGVPRGTVAVMTVYPDSPAAAAGLQVGDLILGPPDKPFHEPNQVREWTMRREVGELSPLEVLRDDAPVRVALRPGPYPLELPELPGPPDIGAVAPEIKVDLFRGAKQLATGRPRLLFFWATWCLPCKAAVPEVLAFAAARNVEVVAITDESAETLQAFFRQYDYPFPEIVARDRYRLTFQNYGVSGTPTFVLIDGSGKVQHYKTGYAPMVGLGIEGWEWKPQDVKPTKAEATDSATREVAANRFPAVR